jgi:hypothetical protein
MGDAVHGQKVHSKYPVVAVDQIKSAPPNPALGPIGEADLPHGSWKRKYRDLMEDDGRRSPAKLIGKEMHLEPLPHGQPFRQFI